MDPDEAFYEKRNMAEEKPYDPFTQHVIDKIDPKARASLSPFQFSAIEKAIRENRPLQGHPVDIRGTIPLFFKSYYYVFLMGRDRRVATKRKEAVRNRNWLSKTALLIFLGMGPFLIFLLFVLYILKTVVGINLLEDAHLMDFLKFW